MRAAIIISLFLACLYFLQYSSLLSTITSAFFLGICWQQLAFTGHDLGHHVVTHKAKVDHILGFIFGNAIQGWYKLFLK